MRKLIIVALVLTLCLSILSVGVSAAASATLNGPNVIRAGDTITLTLKINGQGILGATGTLSYDTNQLEKVGQAQKIGTTWKVDFNGNNILASDEEQVNPINKNTDLLTVTFKVKNVAAGTKITVSYINLTTSDGKKDTDLGNVSWSATVAEPLSTVNTLQSLTVSNATISPAFSTGTTKYTAQVPFEVSKLNINAVATDSKATVSINNPNLVPNGTTKVTITVKAENGSTKTYTIHVSRAQDPNYQPSGNNALSSISVNGFLLSPVFSADNIQYVIWLPYETTSVTVSGAAADSKASVRVEGGSNLIAGQDNEIKVICTAENGTEKVYTVIAKRAAAHGSAPENPTEPTQPTTPPETQPTEPQESEPQESQPQASEPKPEQPAPSTNAGSDGMPWWLLIVALVAGAAIGFVVGKTTKKKQ